MLFILLLFLLSTPLTSFEMYRLLRPTLRPALRFTSRLPVKKFEINPNWEREFNASALTLALDKMSGVDISKGAALERMTGSMTRI